MKTKFLFIAMLLLFISTLFSQVSINTDNSAPDTYYAGVRTWTSLREYFMGTIGDRWSVFDN